MTMIGTEYRMKGSEQRYIEEQRRYQLYYDSIRLLYNVDQYCRKLNLPWITNKRTEHYSMDGLGEGAKPDEVALWHMVKYEGLMPRDAGEIMNMNMNRLAYICDKWDRRKIYSYGVSVISGFPEYPHNGYPRAWKIIESI